MERAEVLIAGGGIIGTSIAWALAARGVRDIVVVDVDLRGVYASSELNAGGARATWWQPVNIETCAATLEFFRQHALEFGWNACGYLWLYADPELYRRALERMQVQNALGLDVESLDVRSLRERFPIVDRATEELVGATFSPRDGLVNPNAVRSWYRRDAEKRGVRFLDRHYIVGVSTTLTAGAAGRLRRIASLEIVEIRRDPSHGDPEGDQELLQQVLTRHRVPTGAVSAENQIRCGTLINCLGAWSPIFSAKIGLADPTEPVRRQISLVDVHTQDLPDGVDPETCGMIVDASGVYFHPEGSHILAGYSIPSEPPGFDFSYDGREFFEEHVWPRLAHRCSAFERCGHVRGWAGLYAVTPDRSGIAGEVAGFGNLLEAHSFTGRGVMQSYGVATSIASFMATGQSDIDLGTLSRARFADPKRWVTEDLHI